MTLSDDLLRGAKAAAAYTGLPESTIYSFARDGRLPVIRMSKRMLLFRKSDLTKALSAGGSE
jgi:excisionase family DNA binding protein